MPLYDWKCEHCDREETVLHKHEDYQKPPEHDCPECGRYAWKRYIGKAPTATKGAGWRGGKGNW